MKHGENVYMEEFMESISYYFQQLWYGGIFKGICAAVGAMYVHTFHGDILLLDFYFVILGIDVALGVLHAQVSKTFNFRYLSYWLRKLLTYMILLVLVGILCYGTQITTGMTLGLVNWYLLICILTELASIIENFRKLGCPIPAPLDIFMRLIRKQVSRRLTQAVGGDEVMQAEVEKALENKNETVQK